VATAKHVFQILLDTRDDLRSTQSSL
jgi:hypothetical protein